MKTVLLNLICTVLVLSLLACGSKTETKSSAKTRQPDKTSADKTKEPLTMFNAVDRYFSSLSAAKKMAAKLQFVSFKRDLSLIGNDINASNAGTAKGVAKAIKRMRGFPSDEVKKVFQDSADELLKALSPFDAEKAKPAYKNLKDLIDATAKKFGN
jgi:hypothetical protein